MPSKVRKHVCMYVHTVLESTMEGGEGPTEHKQQKEDSMLFEDDKTRQKVSASQPSLDERPFLNAMSGQGKPGQTT
jgi:hypothetical protein